MVELSRGSTPLTRMSYYAFGSKNLSVKAYYLLLHFIQSDPSDPFAFLKLD